MSAARDRNWYAVYTVPQHEKSALKQLDMREIESFLPTYETVRVWKNRQRMMECPATFVPAAMRETGMRGALNGTREEEYAGADCEPAAAG
jgi:hypothetical protein